MSSVAERHQRVEWRTQQRKGCIETGGLLKTLVGRQSQIGCKQHWLHWANVPWQIGWLRDCNWCVCYHSNEHRVWWSVSSKILELPSEDNILTCGKAPRVFAHIFYHSRWWPGSEYCKIKKKQKIKKKPQQNENQNKILSLSHGNQTYSEHQYQNPTFRLWREEPLSKYQPVSCNIASVAYSPFTVRCTQLPLWKVSYCCSSISTLHSYQPWSSERMFSIRREDLPCRLARPGWGRVKAPKVVEIEEKNRWINVYISGKPTWLILPLLTMRTVKRNTRVA